MIDEKFEIGFDIDLHAVTQSKWKVDPGERYEDRYSDQIDPRGDPDVIEFEWNRQIKELKDCDTPHLLYLLQIACDLHRQWVIERNQYFTSISRMDRFIDHVDAPLLITNLLKWHNEDKDINAFDGQYLLGQNMVSVVQDVLCGLGMLRTWNSSCFSSVSEFVHSPLHPGKIKLGPATKIHSLLMNDVIIDHDVWTENRDTTLRLLTWGKTKWYVGEKVLEECSVEDVVTLLALERSDDGLDERRDDVNIGNIVDGVFARFTRSETFKMEFNEISKVKEWRRKLLDWARTERMDGGKVKMWSHQGLAEQMAETLIADSVNNERSLQLVPPCVSILRLCRWCPVHRILEEADVMRQKGALIMQSFLRGARNRCAIMKRLDDVKRAVMIIWKCHRQKQQKIGLQKWLEDDQIILRWKMKGTTRFDALKHYLVQKHDAEEKEIDILNYMESGWEGDGFDSDTLQLSHQWLSLYSSPSGKLKCAQFIPAFFADRKCMMTHFFQL